MITAAAKKAKKKYAKDKMLRIVASYNKEFVLDFREACVKLNVTQSELIRQLALETIEKANIKNGGIKNGR